MISHKNDIHLIDITLNFIITNVTTLYLLYQFLFLFFYDSNKVKMRKIKRKNVKDLPEKTNKRFQSLECLLVGSTNTHIYEESDNEQRGNQLSRSQVKHPSLCNPGKPTSGPLEGDLLMPSGCIEN